MKEWQIKLKEWWKALNEREQRVVTAGGVIVAALLFYLIIWGPYLNRIHLMRQHIKTEQQTLAWMRAADKEIKQIETHTKNKSAATTPVALLNTLQKQIEDANLAPFLTDLKQSSPDTISIHFQKVEFDNLMRLLLTILKTQNVSVTQMSVVAENSPGMVNVEVLVKL
jgi:general secretion pathway protein M